MLACDVLSKRLYGVTRGGWKVKDRAWEQKTLLEWLNTPPADDRTCDRLAELAAKAGFDASAKRAYASAKGRCAAFQYFHSDALATKADIAADMVTGVYFVDIDHLTDAQLARVNADLMQLPYVVAVGRSVSRRGVAAAIAYDYPQARESSPETTETAVFAAVSADLMRIGYTVDDCAVNCVRWRVCLQNSEIKGNDEIVTPLPVSTMTAPATPAPGMNAPATPAPAPAPGSFAAVLQDIRHELDGNRSNALLKKAYFAAFDDGLSIDDAFTAIRAALDEARPDSSRLADGAKSLRSLGEWLHARWTPKAEREVNQRYKDCPCQELARVIEQDLPFTFVYDCFTAQIYWGKRDYTSVKDLKPFSFDTSMKTLLTSIERCGIRGGGNREDVKAFIRETAEQNKIDTCQAFLDEKTSGVAPFDVDRFDLYADFLECDRTPFSKALSDYTLTAMWARANNLEQLDDDCTYKGVFVKAMPVLVGDQSVGKSTAIRKLAMRDEFFTDSVVYNQSEGDWARELQGKLLSEFSELAGLSRADQNEIKARTSKPVLRYIPKYMNDERKFIRRDLAIMTTNEDEFLADATGSTRFAPIRVQRKIDLDRIEANAPKIWATAKALYERSGRRVLFEALEALQVSNNKSFAVSDPWDERVAEVLQQGCDVSTNDILMEIGIAEALRARREQMRVSNICKRLGYVRVGRWIDGKTKWVWISKDADAAKDYNPFVD